MNPENFGGAIHQLAPHSAIALFLASVTCALLAVIAVWLRCRYLGSHRHLPLNWVVSVASIAAPVPTWCLLMVMPLDPDLGATVFNDPVVVFLAGLYGLAAAFWDTRRMAREARKRVDRGEPPTDD